MDKAAKLLVAASMLIAFAGFASAQDDACVALWDQPSAAADAGFLSQDYPPASDALDVFAMDDFEIPSGDEWTIERVAVVGNQASPPLTSANLIVCGIWNDDGGVPDGYPVYGGAGAWTQSNAPADAAITLSNADVSFTMVLDAPPTFSGGTYWLSCYAVLDGVFGDWYWETADASFGAIAKLINPGGGHGAGSDFFDVTEVGSATDAAFSLCGQTTGGSDDDDANGDDDGGGDDGDDDDDDDGGGCCGG
ncbi:hypothetical protein K8I61_06960 [bacterium]|nr:hypothetical protein [bacterium]